MKMTSEKALIQLSDRASAKRRSAAKRLGELADEVAGPALLHALQREISDSRTWETQYEMVMALGACDYRPAISFLAELAQRPMDDTALYVALGDSIVRLRSAQEGYAAPLEWCMDRGDPSLVDGALRAVAAMHADLEVGTVDRILDFLDPLDPYDGLRYWAAVAATEWPGGRARMFLESCAKGPRRDVAVAAATSLESRCQGLKGQP
ncbi:HEAT repeat domain-containing protein [Streptomyces sp. SID4985]|uniref:HEAT repeat domain-containing protein n=1 Tax=Streptomyces sp. SID4985 TaxID=2690292 RepID=UPI00136DF5ED|nr:HEAT repeat domain-containing protein [Streptomyces sp. SID4985]MYQ43801.1 HEAT repeat domain-containing protein [Streptomyces sp. SID4985]